MGNYIHILTAPWGIGSYQHQLEDGSWDYGYGFWRPENPHHFSPDVDCCTNEKIAAHAAACKAWDEKLTLPIKQAEKEGHK